jgi:hypothetical protein
MADRPGRGPDPEPVRVSPRRRPAAVTIVPPTPGPDPLAQRRALAFARAWPLLITTVPTADIVATYLDDVLGT